MAIVLPDIFTAGLNAYRLANSDNWADAENAQKLRRLYTQANKDEATSGSDIYRINNANSYLGNSSERNNLYDNSTLEPKIDSYLSNSSANRALNDRTALMALATTDNDVNNATALSDAQARALQANDINNRAFTLHNLGGAGAPVLNPTNFGNLNDYTNTLKLLGVLSPRQQVINAGDGTYFVRSENNGAITDVPLDVFTNTFDNIGRNIVASSNRGKASSNLNTGNTSYEDYLKVFGVPIYTTSNQGQNSSIPPDLNGNYIAPLPSASSLEERNSNDYYNKIFNTKSEAYKRVEDGQKNLARPNPNSPLNGLGWAGAQLAPGMR